MDNPNQITLSFDGESGNYAVLDCNLPELGQEREIQDCLYDGRFHVSSYGMLKSFGIVYLSDPRVEPTLSIKHAEVEERRLHGSRFFRGTLAMTSYQEEMSGCTKVTGMFYPQQVHGSSRDGRTDLQKAIDIVVAAAIRTRPTSVAPELLQGMIDGAVERTMKEQAALPPKAEIEQLKTSLEQAQEDTKRWQQSFDNAVAERSQFRKERDALLADLTAIHVKHARRLRERQGT